MLLQVRDRQGQAIAELLAYRLDQHTRIQPAPTTQAEGFRVYDLYRDPQRRVFQEGSTLLEALKIVQSLQAGYPYQTPQLNSIA